MNGFVDRTVLINLRRRPDRLLAFRESIASSDWPFPVPEVFEAIDGSLVPAPINWKDGGGAWGCMQSHRQVLEKAIHDGVDRLLVLEDDACFKTDLETEVARFFEAVPSDWDQLMLGGQHIGPALSVRTGVVRCMNCQRTHAYVVRGRYMRDLYQRWCSTSGHCDHVMGPFQAGYQVYAPDPFIFGQSRSRSDISGALNPAKFWVPPAEAEPIYLLQVSRGMVSELRRCGVHTGFDRDPSTGLDRGLILAFAEPDPIASLSSWIEMILWEVASGNGRIGAIWHPAATPELVARATSRRIILVEGSTLPETLALLPSLEPVSSAPGRSAVVLLHASRSVHAQLRLRGWHSGHWRNSVTDVDNGLLALMELEGIPRRDQLHALIELLVAECEGIPGGVPVLWHGRLTKSMVDEATDRPVIVVDAESCESALAQLNAAIAEQPHFRAGD